jgi:hypothetical protein
MEKQVSLNVPEHIWAGGADFTMNLLFGVL